MSGTVQFTIGTEVRCADGTCGELRRVVVDPVARTLTHLVVEAEHRTGTGRLVPVALAASSADGILLNCTTAEFEALEHAEETHFVPGARGEWSYGQEEIMSHPHFALAGGTQGVGGMGIAMARTGDPVGSQQVTYDRIPAGEVGVRRGEKVHAADGDIGHVQGLVVDPGDNAVTHVLLDEGHLWGRKRVAIPIGAVTDVDVSGVHLRLSKDEVRDLPPVDLDGLDDSDDSARSDGQD